MHRIAFTLPEDGLHEVGGVVYLEDGFLVIRVEKKLLGLGDGDPHVIKVEPSAIAAITTQRRFLRKDLLVIRPKKPSLLDLVPGKHESTLKLRTKRSARVEVEALLAALYAL
jgi:hypothetical protein